ncbi:hypothetical protein D9M72_622550 [compost metagenome]
MLRVTPSASCGSQNRTCSVGPPRSKKRMLVLMSVYGANTLWGNRRTAFSVNSSSSSCLIRIATPVEDKVPFGTTTAARPGLGFRFSRRIMSWRKSRAVSEVRLSSGKLP